MAGPVRIDYFTDVLCIWAYTGQVRIDELKRSHGASISLNYRFLPLFGAARERIEDGWRERGGYAGFNRHLLEVAGNASHVRLEPEIWLDQQPRSSTPAHLYLKALQVLQADGMLASGKQDVRYERDVFEDFLWRVRCAFFADGRDVASSDVLDEIANEMVLPVDAVHECLADGRAHASLHLDQLAREQFMIPGSPTFVFNDGRQRLYGNVGFRIIEANVRELLHDPEQGDASWC
jgi:predicted DsbA family dithiol-disulfide isomerase